MMFSTSLADSVTISSRQIGLDRDASIYRSIVPGRKFEATHERRDVGGKKEKQKKREKRRKKETGNV